MRIFFILTFVCGLFSQGQGQQVLFSIDEQPTYSDEFIHVYKKNNFNNENAFTRPDIDSYLDLFINFKLKVSEARSLGLDTLSVLKEEFNTYREQLKKPYLSDNQMTDALIREAYDRYLQEVHAAHILIRIAPDASPTDTLKAWQRINDIRNKALQEQDFNELARQFSEDPSARQNAGDLGYFTSMQMVYPFESAAYHTPVGEISSPIRTQFGYHIIKVLDKMPARGKVHAAHIMVRTSENISPQDSITARNRIFEIYERLTAGHDWDEACGMYSEDASTSNNGGELRPFSPGMMPTPFGEYALALDHPGDYSDPFQTAYGWHIVKLIEHLPIESFESMEQVIRNRIKNDSRADLGRKSMIDKLKKENGFVIDEKGQEMALEMITKHTTPNGFEQQLIFTVGNKKLTGKDFASFLKSLSDTKEAPNVLKAFEEKEIIAYEEGQLEIKYPEYRFLLQEYREGILLFKIMDDQVWSAAANDSAGLASFFQLHREDFKWNDRLDADIFLSEDTVVLKELKELVEKQEEKYTGKVLLDKFNKNSALSLRLIEGPLEADAHEVLDKIEWIPGVYEVEYPLQRALVWVRGTIPAGPKELHEARGLVISNFQEYLEEQWITGLKNKYEIKINKKTKKNVYKELLK